MIYHLPYFTILSIWGILFKGEADCMAEIKGILFDTDTITTKVMELARFISKDYTGKELVLICVLKAAAIFTADLMRHLTIPVILEFIQAESYGADKISSKNVQITRDLKTDIKGKHVLLVDTIVDTGETMHALLRLIADRNPSSLNVAVLLDKTSRRLIEVPVAYTGFEVPDEFVVGYGMDKGELYRNLPYIAVLETDTE
jgi:hypoxanthine phosphoribosyltransferase